MNVKSFIDFTNSMSGSGLTDKQIAAKLSEAMASQSLDPEIGTVGLTLLSILSSSNYGDDMTDYVNDFLSLDSDGKLVDHGFSFIGPDADVMAYISMDHIGNDILINDTVVASLNTETGKWISKFTDSAFTLPSGTKIDDILVSRIASSSGQAYSISELMNQASQLDWTQPQTPGIFSDLINDFSAIDRELASSLRGCASGGLMVLNGFVMSLYSELNQALTAAQSDEHYGFVTTSVHVAQFAWGMVAQSVASIVMGIGLAIASVSRVIGAIVAAIGAIASFISKLTANISQSIAGTKYTVSTKVPNPAFNFVLRRYTITSRSIASWILARNSTYMVITSPEIPCNLYMRVLDASEAQPDAVYIEEIPSANFDLVSTVNFNGPASDYGTTCFATDHTNSLFYIRAKVSGAYTNTFGVDQSYDITSLENVIQGAWSPIDVAKYGVIRQVVDNDNQYWHARLMSCLFLYGLCFCNELLLSMAKLADDDLAIIAPAMDNPSGQVINRFKGGIMQQMMWRFGSNIVDALYHGYLNDEDHYNVYFPNETIDSGITYVSEYFDNLAWDEATEYGCKALFKYCSVPAGYDSSVSLMPYKVVADPEDITELIEEEISRHHSFPSYYQHAGYCCICDTPSISLPKTTFAAYIQGLMIDALILLGVAVVVAGTIIAKFKIRNYMARKQANAEAKWYAYQDAVNNSDLTQEQRDLAWKDYKRAKLSYNIPAILTGTETMSPNLSVGGAESASSPAYSIAEVVKLIKG